MDPDRVARGVGIGDSAAGQYVEHKRRLEERERVAHGVEDPRGIVDLGRTLLSPGGRPPLGKARAGHAVPVQGHLVDRAVTHIDVHLALAQVGEALARQEESLPFPCGADRGGETAAARGRSAILTARPKVPSGP